MNVKLTTDGTGHWVVRITESVGHLLASAIDAGARVQREMESWYRVLADLGLKPDPTEAAIVPTPGGIYVVRDMRVTRSATCDDNLNEIVGAKAKEYKATTR